MSRADLIELLMTFNPAKRNGCHICGSHLNFEPSEPGEVEALADAILEGLSKIEGTQ